MRRRFILAASILIILILIAIGAYYLFRSKKNPDELILYGNVDVRQVDIGFRVPGQIEQLFFEEGDLVTHGTLLALLNQTPYDSQLQQAEANVKSIEANFENAAILLKRRRELIEVSGVSQEDLDNALSTYNQLDANKAQAQAALEVARDNLSYTEAFAPTEGIILTRIREPGSVVKATDPVYTLSVTSPVWIRAFISEPQLGQIYYGMPAEIFTDTEDGPVYSGTIGFISPIAEFTPKTVETTQLRTDLVYRLRIYANNPDRYLKQGMPVTVKLKLAHQKEEPSK